MTQKRPTRTILALTLVVGLLGFLLPLTSCGGGGGSNGQAPESVTVSVVDAIGNPVANVTVYLIPATSIDETIFNGDDIRDGLSEDRDEPLEDAIRLNGINFPQGLTDAAGMTTITGAQTGTNYFWFAMPDAGDMEHLPGGTMSRISVDAATFLGTTQSIELTSSPTASATYVGTSTCLVCHADHATQASHAHRLGFAVPGNPGSLQDLSRYPDFDEGWNAFLPGTQPSDGTAVYLSDFDPSRGFDKFKTSLTDPTPNGETVYIRVWLWRDMNDGDKYKVTMENIINPADIGSPRTYEVPLTYGGAIYKQRNLLKVPGRNGLYPFLQIQTQGSDTRFSRTRRRYRDYHGDWYWDDATQTLKDPPLSKGFDANCTACHSTGFERYFDNTTGEYRTHAVSDVAGVYDIDGDGTKDEVNLGCEVCHGPGSDHATWAADPANNGHEGRYIVQPHYLSPSREMQICGRCHDRVEGNGPVANDEPINPQGFMPPVGISRQDYLAQYTTRKGPKASSLWSDSLHSKSHHQQYADFLKSKMHRNDKQIVTCVDCHDSHGEGPFEHHLEYDPDDAGSLLCAQCHDEELTSHMLAETGATHAGNQTTCVRCHMAKTPKSGAGNFGILLGSPTGTSTDDAITYFQNDITSHLFMSIPKKSHSDVAGVIPASAMPIPYTRSCGQACHDASTLQFLTAPPIPSTGAIQPIVPYLHPALEDDDYGSNGTNDN